MGWCLPLDQGGCTPPWVDPFSFGQTPPGRHLLGRHPPPKMATAADDAQPTGMHPCFLLPIHRDVDPRFSLEVDANPLGGGTNPPPKKNKPLNHSLQMSHCPRWMMISKD